MILGFLTTNIGIYIYAILTKDLKYSLWLFPIILYPIIYLVNIGFSLGMISSEKAQISTAAAGIINTAIFVIVFLIGHIVYYKQTMNVKMLLGAFLVLIGALLVNYS